MSAEERLQELQRERRRLGRERLAREVAGQRWRRMVSITPAFFTREGPLEVHRLLQGRDSIVEALKEEGVFASDTAMRLSRGHGFLAGGDVYVYLKTRAPLERLVAEGLIAQEPCLDRVVLRPWPGPTRLFSVIVKTFPVSSVLGTGHRVVDAERLKRELVGTVGPRPDLFALLD